MADTAHQLHDLLHHFNKAELPAIEQAAEHGDAQAQFKLGALYANGKGVTQDSKQAMHWLRAAANQGWVAALTLLGWCHTRGEGFPLDPARAHQYFSTAAEQGDTDAMCALGDLYERGEGGIERNTAAMLQWYERAAQLGHPKAQYLFGKLLARGDRVAQNDQAAFQWLTLAIMNGSEAAQKELTMLSARTDSATLKAWKDNMIAAMHQVH